MGLFAPFIPLMMCDTEPTNFKNRCAACRDTKELALFLCGICGEKKCFHLMKPCSPHCLSCTANAS